VPDHPQAQEPGDVVGLLVRSDAVTVVELRRVQPAETLHEGSLLNLRHPEAGTGESDLHA
jgi:hypothetical protein